MSKPWNGKRILVTGADGFIGSHLAETLLQEGAAVTGLVHYNPLGNSGWLDALAAGVLPSLTTIPSDVQDASSMLRIVDGHDYVFHLASLVGIPYSYESPSSYVQVNVIGTLNVLNACRQVGVNRLVHTSTSEVYGTARYIPIDEEHPLQAQSPYAATKISADMLVSSYNKCFNLPTSIVRPFNTYGPRQSARAVIPTIFSQLHAGSACLKLGSMHPIRDFNFVEDTVRGFMAVASSQETLGEAVNIGSGRGVSIGDLAKMAMDISKHSAEIETSSDRVRPESSEVDRLVCDPKRALELAGWKPAYTLEEGLATTSRWVRDHTSSFRPDLYAV